MLILTLEILRLCLARPSEKLWNVKDHDGQK